MPERNVETDLRRAMTGTKLFSKRLSEWRRTIAENQKLAELERAYREGLEKLVQHEERPKQVETLDESIERRRVLLEGLLSGGAAVTSNFRLAEPTVERDPNQTENDVRGNFLYGNYIQHVHDHILAGKVPFDWITFSRERAGRAFIHLMTRVQNQAEHLDRLFEIWLRHCARDEDAIIDARYPMLEDVQEFLLRHSWAEPPEQFFVGLIEEVPGASWCIEALLWGYRETVVTYWKRNDIEAHSPLPFENDWLYADLSEEEEKSLQDPLEALVADYVEGKGSIDALVMQYREGGFRIDKRRVRRRLAELGLTRKQGGKKNYNA